MKFHKKKSTAKKSNSTQSSGLLKTLNSAIVSANHKQEVSLSVSYVFVQKKLKHIHAHDSELVGVENHNPTYLGNQEVKGMLHCKLNNVAIEGKTPGELLSMFHDTKHDVGADYFVVN